jgi:hypothetical protein
MVSVNSPAAMTLIAQLNTARFQCGVEEGRWSILALNFPHLYVRISASHPEREDAVHAEFHLICDDYPNPGPYVERWSSEANGRAAPPSVGSPGYIDALKDWDHGSGIHGGIYRAWQRYAALHNDWTNKRPDQAWNSKRDIIFIMERLYDLVAEQADWLASRQAA